ncbi:hypothetical protein AX14_011968 [Amanita brunnescens Koide BX004]|nr:hypothetical protein AX14_011968 [Amanita brunnescens Koide BX004]
MTSVSGRPPTPLRPGPPLSYWKGRASPPTSPQHSFPRQDDNEESPSASVNETPPLRPPTVVLASASRATPRSNTKALAQTAVSNSHASSSASLKTEGASTPARPQPPVYQYAYYDAASSSSDAVQSVWNWGPGQTFGHGLAGPRPRSLASTIAYTGPRLGSFMSASRPFMSVDPYPASISYSLGRGSAATSKTWHGRRLSLEKPNLLDYVLAFLLDTIPRQFYSYLLLRLPTMYFARVARIFDEGDMSLHDIAALARSPANYSQGHMNILSGKEPSSPTSPFWNLKETWEALINSLLQEWKTLNIVSVLLLSAILTMLQLPGVVNEPVIFYSALTSQLCSLMSLLYGCVYIIRFGSMRKTYRAIAWAEAAQKTKTVIWWNVWVLLAMPAVWLAWSIILFVLCILMYVWTVNPSSPTHSSMLETGPRLVPRTIISALFGLALIYFALIAVAFNQYGEKVDKEWSQSMTDVRISNFDLDDLSSSREELAGLDVVVQPIPPLPPIIYASSVSPSSSSSRRGRRRSRTPDSRNRRRSRTPDSKERGRSHIRRSRSRTPDRNRSRSRTPDSRENDRHRGVEAIRRQRRRNTSDRSHRSRLPDSREHDRRRVVEDIHRRRRRSTSDRSYGSRIPDRGPALRPSQDVPLLYNPEPSQTNSPKERRSSFAIRRIYARDDSLASRESLLLQTDTAPTLAPGSPYIPPLRHGIPIVPRNGSTYKVVGLWFRNHNKYPMPAVLQQPGLSEGDWERFVLEICAAWDGEKETLKEKYKFPSAQVKPQDFVSAILATWNQLLERQHRLQAVLCREYLDIFPESSAWAVYLLDFSPDESGTVPGLAERFGTVPEGLGKVVILDPRAAPSSISALARTAVATTTIARHELGTHVRFRRDDSESNSGSR